jgi:hypothetical protein
MLYELSQMLEVFDLVDVEGGLGPSDRKPGMFRPGDNVVQFGTDAHRDVVEHVMPAAHPDQVVSAVVGRSEDEIVPV